MKSALRNRRNYSLRLGLRRFQSGYRPNSGDLPSGRWTRGLFLGGRRLSPSCLPPPATAAQAPCTVSPWGRTPLKSRPGSGQRFRSAARMRRSREWAPRSATAPLRPQVRVLPVCGVTLQRPAWAPGDRAAVTCCHFHSVVPAARCSMEEASGPKPQACCWGARRPRAAAGVEGLRWCRVPASVLPRSLPRVEGVGEEGSPLRRSRRVGRVLASGPAPAWAAGRPSLGAPGVLPPPAGLGPDLPSRAPCSPGLAPPPS